MNLYDSIPTLNAFAHATRQHIRMVRFRKRVLLCPWMAVQMEINSSCTMSQLRENNFDCGVYLSANADILSRGFHYDAFATFDPSKMRNDMKKSLIFKQFKLLLHEYDNLGRARNILQYAVFCIDMNFDPSFSVCLQFVLPKHWGTSSMFDLFSIMKNANRMVPVSKTQRPIDTKNGRIQIRDSQKLLGQVLSWSP